MNIFKKVQKVFFSNFHLIILKKIFMKNSCLLSSLVFQILFHQSFSERREKHTILYKVLPNKRRTKESCKSRIELFVTIVKRFKVINYYHKKRPSFDVEKYLNPPIAFRTDSISKSKTKEQRLFEIK